MELRPYTPADEPALFAMMHEEGDWEDYCGDEGRPRYRRVLSACEAYVAYEGEELAGYVRCRDDFGFGFYIYDLLVRKSMRGRALGRALMEHAAAQHPGSPVYVMSGVDPYYEKLGYAREGTIFIVK